MARANILVVEDSFAVARRLQLCLERSGFCVDIARNGREALMKAQRRPFDLVLTDEKMPVMSGREFCRQLRRDARYEHTPIIFLTANPDELDAREMNQELRVSAIFEKPFRPEAIVRLIEVELLAPATAKRQLLPTRHLPGDIDPCIPHPMMETLLASEPDAPRNADTATGNNN